MKAKSSLCIRIFATISTFALFPLLAGAADKAGEAPVAPVPSVADASGMNDESLKALSREEIRTLIHLTSLPDEKLVSLQQSIERLGKMSPEEKRALRQRLEKLRNANDKERADVARQINEQNPPKGNFLVRYWRTLPSEQAKDEAEKFKKMTDEERRAYVAEVRKKMPPLPRDPAKKPPERPSPGGHSQGQERPKRDYEPFQPNPPPSPPPADQPAKADAAK